jgi:hypothetical protein
MDSVAAWKATMLGAIILPSLILIVWAAVKYANERDIDLVYYIVVALVVGIMFVLASWVVGRLVCLALPSLLFFCSIG